MRRLIQKSAGDTWLCWTVRAKNTTLRVTHLATLRNNHLPGILSRHPTRKMDIAGNARNRVSAGHFNNKSHRVIKGYGENTSHCFPVLMKSRLSLMARCGRRLMMYVKMPTLFKTHQKVPIAATYDPSARKPYNLAYGKACGALGTHFKI